MKKVVQNVMALLVLATAPIVSMAQTLVAGWDFTTTATGGTAALASPSTQTSFNANFGSGTISLNGANGSSIWVSASELAAFGGTSVNAGTGFSTSTATATSLALLGGTANAANGKMVVISFSMAGLTNLVVTYATQKTGTGFSSQFWDYSTDGSTWTPVQAAAVTPPAAYATQTLATVTGLDNAVTAYLRLTVTGATSAAGNNRLDNIQLNATSAILPVSRLSFGASKTTGGNLVSWTTGALDNFSHFELQRKGNSGDFSTIATIQPSATNNYSFADAKPLPANYYRLKMIDLDGSAIYSKIAAILNATTGFVISNVYPTITPNMVTVEAFAAAATKLSVKVVNMAGQQVLTQTFTADQTFKQTVDLGNLPAGMYILNVSSEAAQGTYKIIKQ